MSKANDPGGCVKPHGEVATLVVAYIEASMRHEDYRRARDWKPPGPGGMVLKSLERDAWSRLPENLRRVLQP